MLIKLEEVLNEMFPFILFKAELRIIFINPEIFSLYSVFIIELYFY